MGTKTLPVGWDSDGVPCASPTSPKPKVVQEPSRVIGAMHHVVILSCFDAIG